MHAKALECGDLLGVVQAPLSNPCDLDRSLTEPSLGLLYNTQEATTILQVSLAATNINCA